MIIVSGATGRLGSQIVERLLERVPAERLGVSVRDTSRAAALAGRGVRVRAGDFTEPASLEHAFEGAEQVLVISASIRGAAAVPANRAAIDAAAAAGARRILYTSHQAAGRDSLFAPQAVHAAAEEHLAGTGVPFVALRNEFYVSTIGMYLTGVLESGTLAVPEDGPVSWTAHADLAEAAAVALTSDGLPDGVSPPLTAPSTATFADVARELSALTGRAVTRVTVGDEEWKAAAVANGMPPFAADFTLGMFRAARRGEFDVTDPALEKLVGRPAATVRDYLERYLSGGQAD